jgi:hypothetical protein
MRHTHLEQSEKSAVAEQSINTGHCIGFGSTSVLDRAAGYMDCLMKEATEIQVNARNFNRDGGFIFRRPCILRPTCYPIRKLSHSHISTLRMRRETVLKMLSFLPFNYLTWLVV